MDPKALLYLLKCNAPIDVQVLTKDGSHIILRQEDNDFHLCYFPKKGLVTQLRPGRPKDWPGVDHEFLLAKMWELHRE